MNKLLINSLKCKFILNFIFAAFFDLIDKVVPSTIQFLFLKNDKNFPSPAPTSKTLISLHKLNSEMTKNRICL